MFRIELKRKLFLFLVFTFFIANLTTMDFSQKDFVQKIARNLYQAMEGSSVKPPVPFMSGKLMQDNFLQLGNASETYYYWNQLFGKSLTQIFLLFIVILGIGEFVHELGGKSVYYYLNFIDRRRYFLDKTISSLFYLFLSLFISLIISLTFIEIYHYPIGLPTLALAYAQFAIAMAILYSLAASASLFLRKRSLTPVAVIISLLIFLSIPHLLPALYEFGSGKSVFLENRYSLTAILGALGILAAVMGFNYRIFKTMDL